jgi:uncharacterized protein
MIWPLSTLIAVSALVFFVALLYSSVGHGGATGYLALLSLFSLPAAQMAGTALVLNVLVSGIAAIAFLRAGHLRSKLLLPFAIAAAPFAFLGGFLKTSDPTYFLLLALALLAAAVRLSIAPHQDSAADAERRVPLVAAVPVGAGVGLLSGIVGIGGGVFLSPVMMLARWATARQTAAVAAFFILANSLAGLGGRLARHDLQMLPSIVPVAAALAGGMVGANFGASRLSSLALRRILAALLIVAAIKLILTKA